MDAKNMVPKQAREKIAGFPDMEPARAIVLARVTDVIRRAYEQAGYAPLETPLVERPEILAAKASGELKNQTYGLRLLNPAEGAVDDSKHLALRFDLTVPLARYAAANYSSGKIQFPFRRYAIGPVFRGERAGGQRYRQFTQADIDVIGDGELSLLHDSEMVGVIAGIFTKLAVGPFTIRVSNRKVLEGLLRSAGCDSDAKTLDARNAIDDIAKVGVDATVQKLADIGIGADKARELVNTLQSDLSNDVILAKLRGMDGDELFKRGVSELETVIGGVRNLGVLEGVFRVDPSLARGLDYYTGTIYEAYLNAYPDSSIAGGGRFDNLAENFVDRHLPGVGISIGVTRLVNRLIDKNLLHADTATVAPVLVTTILGAQNYAAEYLGQVKDLREAGIGAEIYLNDRKRGGQLQFAAKRGFTVVVITQEREMENKTVTVRNMKRGEEREVPRDQLVPTVKEMMR